MFDYTYVVEPNTVVWVTVLTPSYTPFLLAELITMGLTVQAGDPNNVAITAEGSVSTIICVKINHDENKTVSEIIADVYNALSKIKARYYSIVASGTHGSAWRLGNLVVQTKPSKPNNSTKKNHLRLISSTEKLND